MIPTDRALLATVRDNPGDTHARKVYADALEESGDEVGAHLQRAIAEPNDDGHRLALANAMERTAGEVECPQCTAGAWGFRQVECRTCDSSRRVSDGRKEFGEFIRVQCEWFRLMAYRPPHNSGTGTAMRDPARECRERLGELKARERLLWPAVRKWFGYEVQSYWCGSFADRIEVLPAVLIQRGLPSVVRCTLAEWMGGEECENCGGFGEFRRRHGHDGPEGPCPDCGGKWNSGPHTDHDDYWDCGTGRTPGIGPRLAQAWPIERVEIHDPLLYYDAESRSWLVMKRDRQLYPGMEISVSSFEATALVTAELGSAINGHDSEPAARAALSDACLLLARSQKT